MKYILQIITAITLIVIGYYFASDELRPEFVGGGLTLFITFFTIEVVYDIYENYDRITLILKCKWLAHKKQYIRFSMSYQYRIKINDKYLLVKNSNWNFYQHIGGKYKRLPITQKILADFKAKDDLKLRTTGLMKDDLAVFVPAKNAIKFIDWFDTRSEREISHWREFYEELIEGKGNILSKQNFPYVNYNLVSSIRTPLKKAKMWDCWEILHYDVLDLLTNETQQKELEALFEHGDTDYIKWADDELIQCLGYNNHTRETPYKIGEHARWVVNLKYSKGRINT